MISFQKPFNQFLNYIFIFLILFSCQSPKNNISQEKNKPDAKLVALGKMFFFDTRLSQNNTKSCATCHAPEFAFTDGYRKSSGIFADETKRNAPTLLNSRYLKSLTWADNVKTYEAQMLKPLFSQSPPELGLDSTNQSVFKRFYQDSLYRFFYKINFEKNIENIDYQDIIKSITAYEHSLASFESDYDKKINHEKWAEGERLFFSKKMKCNSCHTAPLFTNSAFEKSFFDKNDKGFFEISKNPNDIGKFRVPTLRHVKLTAPYMHDGSIAELSHAIQHDFFDKNNKKANKIKMTQKEILALLAFLNAL